MKIPTYGSSISYNVCDKQQYCDKKNLKRLFTTKQHVGLQPNDIHCENIAATDVFWNITVLDVAW